MKIKALIITAALIVGSTAASMAAVYSANAVGYVNVTIPASGSTILANPLDAVLGPGNDRIDAVLPLGPEADSLTITRFDPATQSFMDPLVFVVADETTKLWVNGNTGLPDDGVDPLFVIEPGEAFFAQNVNAVALDITFVGDVPQGNLQNPLVGSPTGTSSLNLVSSKVPQESNLGPGADTLGFPSVDSDTVTLWDDAGQTFAPSVVFVQVDPPNPEGVWVDEGGNLVPPEPDPAAGLGPVIPVGKGFFVQKFGAASQSWDRQFNVNEP